MTVDIKKKRDFLRDFVGKFGTQTREENWLLEYLINSEYKLNKIVFVDELNPKFDGFKIYSPKIKEGKFTYISNGKSSSDVSLLFSAIHNVINGFIYVQFDFEGKYSNELYLAVAEEPEGYNSLRESNLSAEEIAQVDGLTEQFIIHSNAGILRDRIDEALDLGNKELFMELTNELNEYIAANHLE